MSVLTLVFAASDGTRKTYTGTVPVAAGQTASFSDFAKLSGSGRPSGMLIPATGLVAPGVTYSMAAKSSTKAATAVKNGTNQTTLMSTQHGGTGAVISGFTLLGTDQGHLYNGLTVDYQTGAAVSSLKIVGVPGSSHEPPGETFPIVEQHGTGNHYSDIEVDGAGVSAASFGANSSTNITVDRLNAHDCPYSRPAFWRTNGITLNDLRSINNWGGINLEQSSGPIRINRPVLHPLDAVRAGNAVGNGMHLHLNNIALDNKDIVITDPDTGGLPFKMQTMDAYTGGTAGAKQSQKTLPVITRNGVPLIWLDASVNNGWGVALKDPLKYAVRFH